MTDGGLHPGANVSVSIPSPCQTMGIVEPKIFHSPDPLKLSCGKILPEFDLIYETYGRLNRRRDNAVLVCHALSGNHHAAGFHHPNDGKPGWWAHFIGSGKPLDTNRFFIVCPNHLGGCHGSTGPMSVDPQTERLYGADFPIVTTRDWVNSELRLAEELGIKRWAAVAGGSLGGMLAMQWAIDQPEMTAHAIVIAAASRLSAQNIAFNEVARQAIISDPDFCGGRYAENNLLPRRGLMLARMLGHITYLSDQAMRERFGRELRSGHLNFGFDVEFQVESYLRHQGSSFVDRFDANTYLLMTKTLDYFDPAGEYGHDLAQAFAHVKAAFLLISFSSDWRFAPERSEEIMMALLRANKSVSYARIESELGHDDFLMPTQEYVAVFSAYMDKIADACEAGA